MDRITDLAAEAQRAPDLRRPGMAGALNAMMARLPAEAAPGDTAARLLELLEEGRLEGLEDEEGQPSSVAATRALLNLGFPHAMQVTPERLAALRDWERRGLRVPWGLLGATLLFATVVQVGFVTLGYTPRYYGLGSGDMGAWAPRLPQAAELWFRQEGASTVFLGQLLANGLGWLAAVTVGRGRMARPWVRRGFLGLGVLGVLAGGAHLLLDFVGAGLGEFASAAGALTAVWLLKSR